MKKMFKKLQARFTRWYIRKGYEVDYDFNRGHLEWICPFRVKLLLMFCMGFFDTKLYSREVLREAFRHGIETSLHHRNRKAD